MTTIPATDPTVPLKAPKDRGDLRVLEFPLEAGVTLVEASAGTGKTFSIVFILIRLLLEGKVKSVDRALVVTFTNAATDELVTRVRAGLRRALAAYDGELPRDDDSRIWYDLAAQYAGKREVVATALASIDGLAVFTIHGFCKRVLEEHAVESDTPYRATFVEDAHDLLEVAALDWWRRTFYPDSRLACLAVAEGWLPDTWLELWKQWRRHPRTTVHPGAPTVDQACDALERVCEEICRTWSRERMAAALAGVDWSVKAPLGDEPIRVMNEAVEALRRGELETLGTLCDCAAEPLETAGKKTSKTAKAALKALADDPFCAACGSIAEAVEQVRRALIAEFMTSVTRDFEAEKERRQALGFDDLLRRLHDGIEREGTGGALCGAIRGRYDAALIDEFQDTDPFQFPIFSTAFRERPLFLIGDPKQAIYGFRGADIFAYADAIRSADHRYTLPQNWRSTEGLVGAVNRLFGRAPRAFLRPADEIGFRDASPAKAGPCPLADRREPLQWWFVPPEGDKACTKGAARQRLQRRAAAEIVSLLEQCEVEDAGELRRVRPADVAILVRTHEEAADMQDALRAANVPSIVAGTGDILSSPEMSELERVLHAVALPRDGDAVRAALATELWGWSAENIRRLLDEDGEAAWADLVDRLGGDRDAWVRRGFMHMVQRWMTREQVAERMLPLADGQRRMTNLRHAIELLHAASEAERLSPDGLLAWIVREREQEATEASRRQLRLETDAEAVQILTIHACKGLEYGIVFCLSLWDAKGRRDPRSRSEVLVHEGDGVVLDLGSETLADRAERAESERAAEELRLAYVALTRAKWRCYVGWGFVNDAPYSPLAWLLRAHQGESGSTCEELLAAARDGAGDAGAWLARLQELVGSAPGLMQCEVLDATPRPSRWVPPAAESRHEPAARVFGASGQLTRLGLASFTSLARHDMAELARDVSDPAARPSVAVSAEPPAGVFALRKGPRTGDLLHAVFELADHDQPDGSHTRELIRSLLRRDPRVAGRLSEDEAVDAIAEMLARVTRASLPQAAFPLGAVPRASTLREWPFLLPLAPVTGRILARAFSDHAGSEPLRRYAERLERLSPREVQGYLTGFVDFAFTRDGRWYLLDWKSNHLGDTPAHYDHARILDEMLDHHYVLQYHLYVLALHRYLASRVAGYRYDRDFGGVYYAFVRGIGHDADGGESTGWWCDKPPAALIDALDAALVQGALHRQEVE